jgi:hypothetical protein
MLTRKTRVQVESALTAWNNLPAAQCQLFEFHTMKYISNDATGKRCQKVWIFFFNASISTTWLCNVSFSTISSVEDVFKKHLHVLSIQVHLFIPLAKSLWNPNLNSFTTKRGLPFSLIIFSILFSMVNTNNQSQMTNWMNFNNIDNRKHNT